MMQCNWYKHAMRRETRRGHWLHVPARARHVSLPRCVVVTSRYPKNLRLTPFPTTHLDQKPLPNQPILAPALSAPRPVPASFQLTACEKCPSPVCHCPSKKPFAHLFDSKGGKKRTEMFPLPIPRRPAPEILPEMTPCCASRHLTRTSLPRRPPSQLSSFSFPCDPT